MFSHAQLTSILATLPDPAFILTRSGRYAALFGGVDVRYYHDGSGLVGQTISGVLVAEKAGWFLDQIRRALDARALLVVEYSLAGSDVKGLESDGPDHPIWFEGRIQALDFLVDGEDAVVWVASNITEKNAIERKLRDLSETDPLTGLFNRRKLLEILEARYFLFRREGFSTSVLMFDVDNFKQINDGLGHGRGDEVLLRIAATCRQQLGDAAMLARHGGDEFVVLMPSVEGTDAHPVADLLRLAIAADIKADLGIETSISGGLSGFDTADLSATDLLKRADEGLYDSKRRGRNRISLVDASTPGSEPRRASHR